MPERNHRPRQLERPDLPPVPLGFKVAFAFCALLSLGLLGLLVWAVITLVNHYT